MEHETPKKVADAARSECFDGAVWRGEWRGGEVYEPMMADGRECCMGQPMLLLWLGGEVEWLLGEEAFAALEALPGWEEEDE